jgi:membrane protease YdiL (CAAX protease family)
MTEDRNLIVAVAWGTALLISDLPDVLFKALAGHVPGRLAWAKVGLLAAGLVACSLWKRLRALRPFFIVFLVFFLALVLTGVARGTPWWEGRFGGGSVSFTLGYAGIYILDCAVALAVIAALRAVKRRRRAFFLVKGDLRAPIGPVRWLGIRAGESWRTFGWIFALAAALAVAVPTLLSVRLAPGALGRAAGLLPAVLLFAAINAFNEEVYFRASFLSTLADVIGRGHTLLVASVFFGMGHYLYGSPPGIVGFLMTAFLGWLLGKSMLETKGLLWPWLIHFLADVVVFLSYALTFVRT